VGAILAMEVSARGLLSGEWRRFALDGLAALVCGYGVDLDWLLAPRAGESRHPPGRAEEEKCR
jgi:hypothetical protein